MKRIFRCPIEAIYMARHYGVRFFYENGSHKPTQPLPFWLLARRVEHQESDDIFIVHPDDEHIFEPSDGDINKARYVFKHGLWRWEDVSSDYEVNHSHNAVLDKIILRNGKAFFCGEIEK